jgi:hypothetical protein
VQLICQQQRCSACRRASNHQGLGEILLEDSLDIESNEDLVADHRSTLV